MCSAQAMTVPMFANILEYLVKCQCSTMEIPSFTESLVRVL
jgi:hypothetical protein